MTTFGQTYLPILTAVVPLLTVDEAFQFPIQQDEHLVSVLRYLERNPLRANLVKRAEDWQWSSLRE